LGKYSKKGKFSEVGVGLLWSLQVNESLLRGINGIFKILYLSAIERSQEANRTRHFFFHCRIVYNERCGSFLFFLESLPSSRQQKAPKKEIEWNERYK
jgi:hypothetical protein